MPANYLIPISAMNQPKQAKEKVRGYIERRQIERRQNARAPLHDPEQIRQEIGWDFVERRQQKRRDDRQSAPHKQQTEKRQG